ncbi:ABC transporter ATP-binding protein [Leucothrix arctica]|uniref:Iron ABC transporter ATP-binding protein n=1 Tax=Leucothrix arctica TaxID=1481894 RepID=A0A317CK82_9GAMM|nr:ABC transporter ATP-binding protein [Leucothrix arctica]PWQ98994.1 iron ABC transporter ATP-binding protein [Leucothrix arctica]
MSVLTLDKVCVAFDSKRVLEDISLRLDDGEIACLLGPSGCGKTTLLRSIAGFQVLQSGEIHSGATVLSTSNFTAPTENRQIGMVFQDFALFPHLTIGDNICFGIRHQSKSDKRQRLAELLELIGLVGFDGRYPHELSGGQQQRVALARAMASKPRLLLLDEPFSSMDVELRSSLAKEIRSILKHEGITSVMVTHDQHEAFNMADRIGVLSAGKLLQWDDAQTLYHQPKTAFVAHFVGRSDFLQGEIVEQGVKTALGVSPLREQQAFKLGQQVNALIRPEYLKIDKQSPIKAALISRQFRGGFYLYVLRLTSGESVQLLLSSLMQYELGDTVGLALSAEHLSVFESE